MDNETLEKLKRFLQTGGWKTTRQCQQFVDAHTKVSRKTLLKTLRKVAEKADDVKYLGTWTIYVDYTTGKRGGYVTTRTTMLGMWSTIR